MVGNAVVLRMSSDEEENLDKVNRPTLRYLGCRLESDGCSNKDVRARINAAWTRWRDVTGVLCDNKMPVLRDIAFRLTAQW